MLPRIKRKGRLAGCLFLAATGAWIWTEVLLLSQNTLLYNGRWINEKRMLRMSVMGADSFLLTRAALSRGRLNLGSWSGFNEVLFRNALRPREFRFNLTLDDGADASVLFARETPDGSPGMVSGLRLSRDPAHGAAFFQSAPSGRFLSKSEASLPPLGAGRHLVDLRFEAGRVKVWLDGKEAASHEADTQQAVFLGWRAGAGHPLIDSVFIEDASGRVFTESFRNTKHWRRLFLFHAAFLLLLWAAASLVPSWDAAGPLLAAIAVGALWLGFDYSYWSGLQLDPLSRPLNASPVFRPSQSIERLRYQLFQRWNGLVTGAAAVTRQDFLDQGYPVHRPLRAIYCSSESICGEAPAAFPAREDSYRILLVGTSQAHGAGAGRLEDTFFVRVHRRLARRFRGRLAIESLNMSVPGSRAQPLLADYKEKYLAFDPDLVLISLGNNDTPDSLRPGLSGFLALNQSRGIKTVLLKEANFLSRAPEHLSKLRVIEELGQEFSVPVWDLNRFLGDAQAADSGFLWWDHAHLTAYGQSLAADWLGPKVAAVIDESRRKRDYEALVRLGEALRDGGKEPEAEAAFQKALALPSKDYRAESALARLNAERGNWEKAAGFYQRARRKAPADYALCMQLAQIYGNMGRLDLAKQTYAQAKSLDPKQAQADDYIREGYEHLRSGEFAQAKERFQRAIEIDTGNPSGYHHMASYFTKKGDPASAERLLRKALALMNSQSPERTPRQLYDLMHTMCNLSDTLEEQGRLDEAETLLRQALSKSTPQLYWHVNVLDMLARLYARQGKRFQAEEYFRLAVALCPPEASCDSLPLQTSAGPLIHLAALYSDEGRQAEAWEAADRAWSFFPSAERLRTSDSSSVDEIGDLYLRLSDDAKAERAYRLLVSQRQRLLPVELLGHAEGMLARLCAKTGRYEEASDLYRKAIRIAYRHGQWGRELRLTLALARTGLKAWRKSP